MVNRISVEDGSLSHFDILLQKTLRYKHHKQNYLRSIEEGLTPTGLKLQKKPAYVPVSKDFSIKWNKVLSDAEGKLVRLLLSESDKVIRKHEAEIVLKIQEEQKNNIENTSLEKLERKHSKFKERLSQKRNRKWQNLKEKNLKGLEHLLLAERKSSKNFVNGALKNVKERKIEEKNEVLDVSKDLDMMRFGKKELDEKFIIGKRKYRNINCAIETNKEECENLRTSSQKVKSPLPLSYAEVTKAGQMKKEVNFSELYLNLLETEQTNSAKMETTRPTLCTNSSECQNSSFSLAVSNETELFSTQDREFVSIIVDLENLDNKSEANAEVTKTGRTEKEVNFSELYLNLLETEKTNFSKMETTQPTLCTNSSEC